VVKSWSKRSYTSIYLSKDICNGDDPFVFQSTYQGVIDGCFDDGTTGNTPYLKQARGASRRLSKTECQTKIKGFPPVQQPFLNGLVVCGVLGDSDSAFANSIRPDPANQTCPEGY